MKSASCGLGALSSFYLLLAFLTAFSFFLIRRQTAILLCGHKLTGLASASIWFVMTIAPLYFAWAVRKRKKPLIPLAILYHGLFLINSLLLFTNSIFPQFGFPPITEIASKKTDVLSVLPGWAVFLKRSLYILSAAICALIIKYLASKRTLFNK